MFLDDQNITDYPMYKRSQLGIGYLPQEVSVFRKLSVEDNIMAILEMTDLSKPERLAKLEKLLDEFSLQHVRKNLGNRLSGGEKRRTEIARALATDPKFVLLDEPFAGVDPIAVEDIQSIIAELRNRNIGILITDHNVQETLSITDRAYLLFEGGILKSPARITVFHNGVLIHNNVSITGSTQYIGIASYQVHGVKAPLMLQDHGNTVSFRNIWVREL